EVESNDTPPSANPLDGFGGVVASINPSGDQDYFSFNVTVPGSKVTLEVTDGFGGCPAGFDSKLYLLDANNNQLCMDDDGRVAACSLISPQLYPAADNLTVGMYYVRVEKNGNVGTQPLYVLKFTLKVPGCGDGIVQAGEQCDDGNLMNGDGCSSNCTLEG